MRRHTLLISFLTVFLLSINSRALTVTESFNSNANKDSDGGMVWNIALGELHPPIKVDSWDDGGGPQPLAIDVGDGSDGAFVASRYALFDDDGVVTGNVIEINTDTHPNLQFTQFNLASGYTIRPTGSSPLVIRVQSTVTIDGTIDCSGESGGNATTNVNATIAGGSGICGGGAGGNSVPASTAPGVTHQGAAGGAAVSGGAGGPVCLATGGQGGGGGGSFIKNFVAGPDKPDPTDGDNSVGGSGGLAGTNFRDDSFTVEVDGAGSGGGGGSAFDDIGDVANHMSGASGGGGGGNIRIYAVGDVTLSATGVITADGGAGGSSLTGKGGGGGGGAGGSILIFSGGDIVLDGPVTAAAGAGGTTAGGDGGTGAWGRTWIIEKDGFAGGGMIEDPQNQLNDPSFINYETLVTYTVTSRAIDLGNTIPFPTSLPITVANLGGSTLTYEIAFSDSSDLSTLTNYNLPATYLNADQKRFARVRIQIDNLDAITPVSITDLSFVFSGNQVDEFNFSTGCGRVGGGGNQMGQAVFGGHIFGDGTSAGGHHFGRPITDGFYSWLIFMSLLLLPMLCLHVMRLRISKN